jgi:hypothetical protein
MYDFIAIGDSTLDVFLQLSEASRLLPNQQGTMPAFVLNTRKKSLSIKSRKSLAPAMRPMQPVGASRMGLRSAIVSILGKDDIGKEIIMGLEKRKSRHQIRNDRCQTRAPNYSTVPELQRRTHNLGACRKNAATRSLKSMVLDGSTTPPSGPGHERMEKTIARAFENSALSSSFASILAPNNYDAVWNRSNRSSLALISSSLTNKKQNFF